MAILSKIRERSLALIAVIGLALFAFVLDPSTLSDFFNSSKVNEIGEVSGESISREEFASALEDYKRQTQNRASEMQAAKAVWDNLVRKKIYKQQLTEAGITIGEADVWEELLNSQPVKSNPQFLNEAGLFDEEIFKQFLADTKENDENLWAAWENYMNQIRDNTETTTYNNLVSAGLGASLKEGEIKYNTENTKLTSQYVYIPYTSIADSLISVSKAEKEAYIKSHQNDFKVDASRDISYVKFEVKATQEDEEAIKKEVAGFIEDSYLKDGTLVEGIRNAENLTDFFAENGSDINLIEKFQFKNEFPKNIGDLIFATGNKSDVIGPYKDKGFYKISKVTEVTQMPDSVRASHILIPFVGAQRAGAEITKTEEQAKKTADSIARVVKRRKSKFSSLAKAFSSDKSNADKGGDLDWFAYNRMVPEFRDFCFSNRKGSIEVVKTAFGFHVIHITDQTAKQKALKLATFGRQIVASEATENTVFQEAEKFALEVSKEKKFFDIAKEKKYATQPVIGLKVLDESVPGIGNQRQVVTWAFNKERKLGDFKRFDLENGHIVAFLTAKNKEGLISAKKATNRITPILTNQKKAKMIAAKINGTTLAEIAEANNVTVKTANGITFKSPTISGVGNEPKTVGAMFYAEENKLYTNIEGNKGVFAFVVTKKEAPTALPNYSPIRNQISASRKTQTNQMFEAIKEASKVKDYRASFYGVN